MSKKIENESDVKVTTREDKILRNVIKNKGTSDINPSCVSFYAQSGDDVYLVINSTAEQPGRFLYAKLLYGPENGCTHFISDAQVFDSQFAASMHLCAQALEEEKGYARADD